MTTDHVHSSNASFGTARGLLRGGAMMIATAANAARHASVARFCRQLTSRVIARGASVPVVQKAGVQLRDALRRHHVLKMPVPETGVQRDVVDQASWESFPASDSPGY